MLSESQIKEVIEGVAMERDDINIYNRDDISYLVTESLTRILQKDCEIVFKSIDEEEIDWKPDPKTDTPDEELQERIEEYNSTVSNIVTQLSIEEGVENTLQKFMGLNFMDDGEESE